LPCVEKNPGQVPVILDNFSTSTGNFETSKSLKVLLRLSFVVFIGTCPAFDAIFSEKLHCW
jgi:hypothetical protein